MFPLLGPLISGGASLLGSIFSSSTSASNTQQQIAAQQQMQTQSEDFNAGQAQISRDYNTQMSNTAYQRASSDMKAAGLNPMMMFGSGGAASTPPSPTASVGTPNVPMPQKTNPLAGIGQAAASAIDTMVKDKQVDLMSTEMAKIQATQKLTGEQTEGQRLENIRRGYVLPSAELEGTSSGRVLDFLKDHPMIAQAASVGPYLGQSLDKTAAPVFDTLSSLTGGWKNLLQYPNSPTKTFQGNSAASKAYETGGPEVRQRWKDSGGSEGGYDEFKKMMQDYVDRGGVR